MDPNKNNLKDINDTFTAFFLANIDIGLYQFRDISSIGMKRALALSFVTGFVTDFAASLIEAVGFTLKNDGSAVVIGAEPAPTLDTPIPPLKHLTWTETQKDIFITTQVITLIILPIISMLFFCFVYAPQQPDMAALRKVAYERLAELVKNNTNIQPHEDAIKRFIRSKQFAAILKKYTIDLENGTAEISQHKKQSLWSKCKTFCSEKWNQFSNYLGWQKLNRDTLNTVPDESSPLITHSTYANPHLQGQTPAANQDQSQLTSTYASDSQQVSNNNATNNLEEVEKQQPAEQPFGYKLF